ncbi:hypothetical protein [Aneurinibacillus migulanus]|uniref:Uncharacterized protein n=1 Tax=Aneurinibacillus migulanus TaxID=47500 RepID=A0A1G8NSM7_ANEMI|nr:hypothetical protein [Aneurinibacillus migulanus]MED0890915.1 hypothetical protein [Aneurinibacillus migulanus]MED1616607.1 hypothetical protein [Aneurinibacillus migulanus]GED13751.1 hypothetical protein AMI01nite_17420 [Aneurinibacillus migulanus]SDI82490.1 hypothetical protein SAMN04487909_10870 [Aneurinibacillus migulanus]
MKKNHSFTFTYVFLEPDKQVVSDKPVALDAKQAVIDYIIKKIILEGESKRLR